MNQRHLGQSQMVLGRPGCKSAWSSHLEQLCVWQTFGLLTTHRQDPSCSSGACQLSTQMGLWESQASVYQSLDVTPLFQTSMPPLSLRASPQRCSIWEVEPLRWGVEFPKFPERHTQTHTCIDICMCVCVCCQYLMYTFELFLLFEYVLIHDTRRSLLIY